MIYTKNGDEKKTRGWEYVRRMQGGGVLSRLVKSSSELAHAEKWTEEIEQDQRECIKQRALLAFLGSISRRLFRKCITGPLLPCTGIYIHWPFLQGRPRTLCQNHLPNPGTAYGRGGCEKERESKKKCTPSPGKALISVFSKLEKPRASLGVIIRTSFSLVSCCGRRHYSHCFQEEGIWKNELPPCEMPTYPGLGMARSIGEISKNIWNYLWDI